MWGKVCQRYRHAMNAACRADSPLARPESRADICGLGYGWKSRTHGDTYTGVENL
jgi:hypothetical protein